MTPSRPATETIFASHDGQAIFYRHWKETTTPANRAIVILHRGHEHSGRVEHIVNELEMPDTPFFAWDVRGCGRTEGTRGYAKSFMTWVQDLEAFIQHIHTSYNIPVENIVVIAQSVGAVIASAWVHDYAPKIKALVVASPAFSVKLYIPFAVEGIALWQKLAGQFFVKSYVKGKHLTHDTERAASYHTDPLVALPIASNVLLELYSTSERVIADAGAIVTPVQVLISGNDFVVRHKPQHTFYNNLSSALKEKHLLPGFFHDTLGEKGRAKAFAYIKAFIAKVESTTHNNTLLNADKKGYTYNEYQQLLQPKASSFFKELSFALTRSSMKLMGKHASKGLKIGMETGFDSGSSLDYVYLNKAQGMGLWKWIGLGKVIDRGYLDSIGWQGIRIRKLNLETLIRKYMDVLKNEGTPIRVMDIASGHGRYILDAIEPKRSEVSSILLRDYSDINVKAGAQMILDRKLSAIAQFKNANAFDEESIAAVEPRPTIGVVSGVYELFSDNNLLIDSLKGLSRAILQGGYLIYTNQPWHPQVELIARTLNNHEGKDRWVMRRRTQAEMDELVAQAGFKKGRAAAGRVGNLYRFGSKKKLTMNVYNTSEPPQTHWLRGFLWLAVLAPLFFIVYGWANGYASTLPVDAVGEIAYSWEQYIPFLPWTIFPYWSIDFLYGLSLFLPMTKFAQRQHALRLLVATPVAAAFFYFFPLTFSVARPPVEGLWKVLFDALLGFDKPFNQSPSLHIILLVILWQIYLPQFGKLGKVLWHTWCFLIGISVLTTFQHHFIDIPAGFLVGVVICFIFPLAKEHQWNWQHKTDSSLARNYLIAGILLIAAAILAPIWPAMLLLWIGISICAIGLGYRNIGPLVFQKHDNGSITFAARIIHFPYRSISRLIRHLFFVSYTKPQQITDHLYLGAYSMHKQVPCNAIFDVCSEYERANYDMPHYVHYPLIDLVAPTVEELRIGVQKLNGLLKEDKTVFIHCALGMSRSAILVMAWLIHSNKVATAEEAIQYFKDHNFRSKVSSKTFHVLQQYASTRTHD